MDILFGSNRCHLNIFGDFRRRSEMCIRDRVSITYYKKMERIKLFTAALLLAAISAGNDVWALSDSRKKDTRPVESDVYKRQCIYLIG